MGKVAAKAPENKPSDYLQYEGEGVWWTSDPKGESRLQSSKTGYASYSKVPLKTLPELFATAVKLHGNKPAMRTENMPNLTKGDEVPPALPLEKWKTWNWVEYQNDVKTFAKAAIKVGFEPFDSINIFGSNSPEWCIAMFGAIFGGGKVAGIYPTDTADSVKYKADHSNGSIAVIESDEQLSKYSSIIDDLPYLKVIVCWGCEPNKSLKTTDGRDIETYTFKEFMKLGSEESDDLLEERLNNLKPSHCAALVYTSGTTGRPKAVMISHDSIHFQAESVFSISMKSTKKEKHERIVSYLPLSHVAGMMVDLVGPVAVTATANYNGYLTVHFARSYDLKKGTLINRIQTVKPTLFLGVPRVWEKIMERLLAVGATTKGLKKRIANFAKSNASVYNSTRQLGGKGKTPKLFGLAKIVLNQIKAKLGLDKCHFMLSGAAPLSFDAFEYFASLNININETYGMSETCGGSTMGNSEYHVWGSVGFEQPGCEVRIMNKDMVEVPRAKDLFHPTEEEQGEVCMRGRGIMMGYMANERLGEAHMAEIEEKNHAAMDENGWIHSGDKGTRDKRGMYRITGRYKEIIIGAGGENIAPVPIEDEIKRLCPVISNVIMVGNKRKFNVLLVTLKTVGASGELPGGEILDHPASLLSNGVKTLPEAMHDKGFEEVITKAINETNENKEVVPSNAARIQKFTILPRDFSIVTGELTATLKLKRSIVEDKFEPIISKMYEVTEMYVKYELAPTVGLNMGLPTDERQISHVLSQKFVEHAIENAIEVSEQD